MIIAGTENETGISAAVIFDNEEVGNISKNGAFSRVTSTILKLIYCLHFRESHLSKIN